MSQNHSRRFSLDEIRKATDNFNKSKIIGAGGFGRVYKGVIDHESKQTLVAVKRTLDPESKQGIQGLETEIKMLAKCRHSNLVTLLGYCNENQEMILVYEYMSRGNLADHLYGNRGAFLTWEQRLKICIGAARGLDYLHTGTGLSERIVHLDVKSDNILLDDNLAAKVADLGLSQVGPANQQNTRVNTVAIRGTPGYMDPEYLRTYTYSSKSDVYSFGVVLLEVLSGTSVWAGQLIPKSDRADWIQQYISEKTLVQIVDPRIVTTVQYGSLKRFVHTASNMLQLDSMKRPAMTSVVAQLASALELQSSSPVIDDDDPIEVRYEGETEIFPSKNMSENHSRRFSLDEIRKATDNFNKSKIIGAGGFGRVYKGVIDHESKQTLVAVKRTLDPESKQGIQGLETEIKMLAKCRHSNLVTFLGYCNENQEMILVYEYMSRGNLADHLYGNSSAFLTWEQRLKICIGVARGLDYLHTGTGLSERIVHLDVKSDNILLDDNLAAKVADLGLSQVGPANQQNTRVNTRYLRGTEGYVDPEYSRTFTYSSKSDVYSFGVVLLEVLSGTSVYRSKIIPKSDRADWIQQYISEETLVQIVDPKILSKVQYGSLKSFVHTASNMLQLDSMKRPAMSSVVAQLESALELQIPVVDDDDDDPNEVVYEGKTFRPNFPKVSRELALKSNVFFEPIEDKQMLQMRLDPSHTNKSNVAYHKFEEMEDDEWKSLQRFLIDVTLDWGNVITTGCMIFNATGETLTYVTSRNHYGAAPSYPRKIRNGQWGAFIHTKTSMIAAGSVGAVVYRGKYTDNASCDRMITWSTRIVHGNAAYAEINEVGYFDVTDWDAIFKRAKSAGRENLVTWKDCHTRVGIERGPIPEFRAIMY